MIRCFAICFTLLLSAPLAHAQSVSDDFALVFDSIGKGVQGCSDDFQIRGYEDNSGGRCDGVVEEESEDEGSDEGGYDEGGESGGDGSGGDEGDSGEGEEEEEEEGGSEGGGESGGGESGGEESDTSGGEESGGGGGSRNSGGGGGGDGGTNVAFAGPLYTTLGDEVVDASLYQQADGIVINPKGQEVPIVWGLEEEPAIEDTALPTMSIDVKRVKSDGSALRSAAFSQSLLPLDITKKISAQRTTTAPLLLLAYLALAIEIFGILIIRRLTLRRSMSSAPQKEPQNLV